jgi:4-hydroxy-2-oxoheptanedioate aldolase
MNIRPNRVKRKLAEGKTAFVMAGVADADTIEQLGPCGADGFWLEGEHGPIDFADISGLTRACDIWGMTSVLRIHQNEYGVIYRALDRGAQGLVMPHVNTREEAENFVRSAKFAPIGKRGMFTSRQGYGVPDYFKRANDETLLVILIEDIAAVRSLDSILKVDNIDVFFVAPSDLATSMGHIGDFGHPEVQKVLDGALTKIVRSGRTAGALTGNDGVERLANLGVRFFMTGINPWIEAGVKQFAQNAAKGTAPAATRGPAGLQKGGARRGVRK